MSLPCSASLQRHSLVSVLTLQSLVRDHFRSSHRGHYPPLYYRVCWNTTHCRLWCSGSPCSYPHHCQLPGIGHPSRHKLVPGATVVVRGASTRRTECELQLTCRLISPKFPTTASPMDRVPVHLELSLTADAGGLVVDAVSPFEAVVRFSLNL